MKDRNKGYFWNFKLDVWKDRILLIDEIWKILNLIIRFKGELRYIKIFKLILNRELYIII